MHLSEFANELRCQHCGETHGTKQWPVNGDMVPFYYQKEAGRYSLTVTCPHCGKEWNVVWDENPGPIMPLTF
jgi:Zn finger protein HypA/HybF involved in hydrogenase expression